MLNNKLNLWSFALLSGFLLNSCSKSSVNSEMMTPVSLSYGNPVLFTQDRSSDYFISPVQSRTGVYTSFPEGLVLDAATGAINMTKSETGMSYRISYTSPKGDTASAAVTISGINFIDGYYRLSTADSMISPLYVSGSNGTIPSGSAFDPAHTAQAWGCAIRNDNGKINLKQTVRNAVFGTTPVNDTRRDIEIPFQLNDNSNHSSNKIKVRFFYYNTMADVPHDVLQLLQDRHEDGLPINGFAGAPASSFAGNNNFTESRGKDRPPCVILIAN